MGITILKGATRRIFCDIKPASVVPCHVHMCSLVYPEGDTDMVPAVGPEVVPQLGLPGDVVDSQLDVRGATQS